MMSALRAANDMAAYFGFRVLRSRTLDHLLSAAEQQRDEHRFLMAELQRLRDDAERNARDRDALREKAETTLGELQSVAAEHADLTAKNAQLTAALGSVLRENERLSGELKNLTTEIEAQALAAEQAAREALARPWMHAQEQRILAAYSGQPDYDELLTDVMAVLTAPDFIDQPLDRQVGLLELINACMLSKGHAQASAVAFVMARHVGRLLRESTLGLSNACRLHDALYQTWWCASASLDDMRPIYAYACLPFRGFLERHGLLRAATCRRSVRSGEPLLRIAYLFHYAHGQRGNSMLPLMLSLTSGHAAVADRQIFAYAVQWVDDQWLQATFAEGPVTARSIPQRQSYHRLDELFEQLQQDAIDVIVSDAGTSITAYLFARRAAPIQLWIDMGTPYIYYPEMDMVLQAGKRWRDGYPATAGQSMEIHIYQEHGTMFREAPADAMAEARAAVPSGGKVIGVITRLIKITPQYLDFVRGVLLRHPMTHLLIVGPGDPRLVQEFMAEPALAGRITFIHRSVDIAAYAQVIDLFLDTFPFIGGIACREVGAHGVPIIGLRTHEWDRMQDHDRDHAAIAPDLPSLAKLVDLVLTDDAFALARGEAARAVAQAGTDVMTSVFEIEAAIDMVRQRGEAALA